MPTFVKIGNGKCDMYASNDLIGKCGKKIQREKIFFIRPQDINLVTKEILEGEICFYFYLTTPNMHKIISCISVDKDYEAYVEKIILEQAEIVSDNNLAAIKGHLETLLVVASERKATDEPLFE